MEDRYEIQRNLRNQWFLYDKLRDQILLITSDKKVVVKSYINLTKQ